MAAVKKEDLLSDVEPFPASPSSSPPPSFLAPSVTDSCLPLGSVARSWPPSPLSTLSASSQVTTRLYASLRSSQGLGLCGPSAPADRPRQVTFSLASPGDPGENATPWHGTSSPSFPEGQEEHDAGRRSGSPSPPSLSAGDEALELEDMAEEMSVNLQASVEQSSAPVLRGRQHIQDMESVRSHLQTILRAGSNPSEWERGANYLSAFRLLEGPRKDASFDSDTTSNLISAPVLADTSPPLSFSTLDELFPRYTRLRTSVALPTSSETQLLRESLDRERIRRKQCEKQIQALQNKALQLQQQLALAASADRKKDIMIEQLDKTLAKVVEGWRKHEEEEGEELRRLQEEKEEVQRSQAKQQEVLLHLETSLSEAAQTLDHERKHRDELNSTKQQLEKQLVELHERLEEQERQGERAWAELEEAHREAQEARASLAQQREAWACRERELQERLGLQGAELDKEKVNREHEAQRLQEAQRELRALQSRLQELEREVEEARRERDGARMDRALDQARFEAQRTQLEVELKLSVEQQVTERLSVVQKENAESSASLREQHRKQLLELSARQETELCAQLAQFRAELQERDDRQRRLADDYERRLSAKQEELQSLEASRRKLEAQRTELVSRLQGLMRSHWAEALKLLATQGQMDDSPPLSFLSKPPLYEATEHRVLNLDSGVTSKELPQSSSLFQCVTGTDNIVVLPVPLDRKKPVKPPGALAPLLAQEPPQTREKPPLHNASPQRSQLDASTLLNHSSTFCALEPQLDDTVVTVSGSCESSDNLCKVPVSREEDGSPRSQRGLPWKGGHGVMEAHGVVESEFRARQERMAMEGYPSSSSQGLGDYQGDRGRMGQAGHYGEQGVSVGYGKTGDWEDPKHSSKEQPYSVHLSGTRVEALRNGPTGDEQHGLGERGQSSWGLGQRQTGAHGSNIGALQDTCYSGAAGSQSALFRVSVGSVGSAGTAPSGTASFVNVPPMGRSTAANPPSTGAQEDLRQTQLQYYVNMLLDRSPGEPMDASDLSSSHEPASVSSTSAQTSLGASWENKGARNPAGPVIAPLQPPSSAVTKTKLRPSTPCQAPQPGPLPQDGTGPSRASLTALQLAQLSHLVAECRSRPDAPMPSLEDLLDHLLSDRADRFVGSGEEERDTSLYQSLQQSLGQGDPKEQTVVSSQQRRVQAQRMTEGSRTQSHAPRGRRGGAQAQRAACTRGSVWR